MIFTERGLPSVGGSASGQHGHPALMEEVSEGDTWSLFLQREAFGAARGVW